MTWHTTPDGRRFRTFKGRCVMCSPCWQARCECGEYLTKHDEDEAGATRCALGCMAKDDPRPGFGHLRCKGIA